MMPICSVGGPVQSSWTSLARHMSPMQLASTHASMWRGLEPLPLFVPGSTVQAKKEEMFVKHTDFALTPAQAAHLYPPLYFSVQRPSLLDPQVHVPGCLADGSFSLSGRLGDFPLLLAESSSGK